MGLRSNTVPASAHPTDGRQVLLSVTQDGEALLREDRRRREAWPAQRLAEPDDDERRVLRDAAAILDRLASR